MTINDVRWSADQVVVSPTSTHLITQAADILFHTLPVEEVKLLVFFAGALSCFSTLTFSSYCEENKKVKQIKAASKSFQSHYLNQIKPIIF